jgi:hypothetical protein
MKDRQPGWEAERGPNYGLPTVLGDQCAHLPSERLNRPLTFSLGHVDHASEIDLIAPKEVRESGREIVHREICAFASGVEHVTIYCGISATTASVRIG